MLLMSACSLGAVTHPAPFHGSFLLTRTFPLLNLPFLLTVSLSIHHFLPPQSCFPPRNSLLNAHHPSEILLKHSSSITGGNPTYLRWPELLMVVDCCLLSLRIVLLLLPIMKLSTSSDALISTCGSQSADISDTMPLKRVRRHNVRSDGKQKSFPPAPLHGTNQVSLKTRSESSSTSAMTFSYELHGVGSRWTSP